jgi:hypothetical protein
MTMGPLALRDGERPTRGDPPAAMGLCLGQMDVFARHRTLVRQGEATVTLGNEIR